MTVDVRLVAKLEIAGQVLAVIPLSDGGYLLHTSDRRRDQYRDSRSLWVDGALRVITQSALPEGKVLATALRSGRVAVGRRDALSCWDPHVDGAQLVAAVPVPPVVPPQVPWLTSFALFALGERELWLSEPLGASPRGSRVVVRDASTLGVLAEGVLPETVELLILGPFFDDHHVYATSPVMDPQDDWNAWILERRGSEVVVARRVPLDGREFPMGLVGDVLVTCAEPYRVRLRDARNDLILSEIGPADVCPMKNEEDPVDSIGMNQPVVVGDRIVMGTERGYFAFLPRSAPRPENLVLVAPPGETPKRLGSEEEDHYYGVLWGMAGAHPGRLVSWTHQGWTETSSVVRLWEIVEGRDRHG